MNATDVLRAAHETLRRMVPASRRSAKETDGALSETFKQAMRLWDSQKADGVSEPERLQQLENILRVAWPKGREEPWKSHCSECRDYGLVLAVCPGDATCGRSKPHLLHDFGKPCWCALGRRFHEKSKPTAEDFTQAGRSKPMARMGR